jgi:hypothetical protein
MQDLMRSGTSDWNQKDREAEIGGPNRSEDSKRISYKPG